MDKKLLLVLDGFSKKNSIVKCKSKIMAFMEPSTGIFTGIEFSQGTCDFTSIGSISQYLESACAGELPVSLVTGVCNGDILHYIMYVRMKEPVFGNFQYNKFVNRFFGQEINTTEKSHTNRWEAQLKMVTDLDADMIHICELIEKVLGQQKDGAWEAMQYCTSNNTLLWGEGHNSKNDKIENESTFPLRSFHLHILYFLGQNDFASINHLIKQYLESIHAIEYEEIICELFKIGQFEKDTTHQKMLEALEKLKDGNMLDSAYYEALCRQAFLSSNIELGDMYSQVATSVDKVQLSSLTNAQLKVLSETGILKFSGVSHKQKEQLKMLSQKYPNVAALEVGEEVLFKLQKPILSNRNLSLQLGEEAYESHQYSICIPYYLDALENQIGLDPHICFKLGYAYFKTNHFEPAITYLTVADMLGYHNHCAKLLQELNDRMKGQSQATLPKDTNEQVEPCLEEIAILVSAGRSIEEVASLFHLNQEQIQMLKITVAENHYMLGQYTVGDQYLNRVAPNTTEVKKYLKNAQMCRKVSEHTKKGSC